MDRDAQPAVRQNQQTGPGQDHQRLAIRRSGAWPPISLATGGTADAASVFRSQAARNRTCSPLAVTITNHGQVQILRSCTAASDKIRSTVALYSWSFALQQPTINLCNRNCCAALSKAATLADRRHADSKKCTHKKRMMRLPDSHLASCLLTQHWLAST